ncbi:NADH-quinone oxidoreductase subunit NuoF [Myxococcota bacterium]|nr:NADH-quinone oxidoreductase subunit NuoF [Myxococcota bacterium]
MAYTILDGHKTLLNFPRGAEGTWTLDSYRTRGGYSALEAVLREGRYTPAGLLDQVKKSGLRGRGGAGFPTGLKWSFLAKQRPAYLVCNADESEPGTFKDRVILEENPHQLVEGMILSLFALEAEHGYVYVRGEYVHPQKRLDAAIREAYEAGYLGEDVLGAGRAYHITLHSGAGAYICGEETGLINSLEGRKGQPRLKPPFPAVIGVFNKPTIVNNVETLASVCSIAEFGGEAYAQWRNESGKSTGTKLFSVSGHVERPGVYEVPMGYPFKRLLEEECGGMLNGMPLKALIVGGSSVPVVDAETAMKIDLDYESCAAHGTLLGSGGVIVMGEGTCMVRSLEVLLRFYHHESCGQCTPCREGTGWIHRIVRRVEAGQGTMVDLDELYRIADNMEGKTICTLADAAAWPAKSHLRVFRQEFERHVHEGRCPFGGRFPDPFHLGPQA